MKYIIQILMLITFTLARKGFGPTEQEWGFVEVREGAHLFWWLHQTNADVENYTDKPLVIWLQGGPGASSTGYGNFAELGPLDPDLNPRNTTWLNNYNVLFVDNPVGAGYSYVDTNSALTTTNRQQAEDFVVMLQGFYETVPELLDTPLYIFSESYGGKYTVEIALAVDQAIKDGLLNITLVGVGLGDAAIAPTENLLTYATYLFNVGVIDQDGLEAIQKTANATKDALDSGDGVTATATWNQALYIIEFYTAGIDFYNILKKIPTYFLKKNPFRGFPLIKDEVDDQIDVLMNGEVKEALGINGTWGVQSDVVYDALYEEIMQPITDRVEALLNNTNIRVAVYNGQLDLIVDMIGTINWINELHFEESDEWQSADRNVIGVDGYVEGYYKKAGNLALYWVDRAGHMVPADNPNAMDFILNDVITGQWKN